LSQSMLELPVLDSRNLVNWSIRSCARDGRRREPLRSAARSEPRAAGGDTTMRDPFGRIRFDALSAPDLRRAPTCLTLYAVEPRSTVTVALNVAGLQSGDVAGLALFSRPSAWLAAERGSDGLTLARIDEEGGTPSRVRLPDPRVWLRAECDFVRNEVAFRYSTDGSRYAVIGQSRAMVHHPGAAHGIRCSLFSRSTTAEGGYAEFDSLLMVTEFAGPTLGSRP
jgi:xylan 1,4-beta-xylosidase